MLAGMWLFIGNVSYLTVCWNVGRQANSWANRPNDPTCTYYYYEIWSELL